ncbi:protein Star [Lingula anatina]|uniref:Protein Star n=1 Tax=Lingula anatina TaxID=7574 RepID=A0A2R2MJX1_LINAN|nr:protein Star [Lingula anatina]|eukprot:XP_023930495.1 protein Star [Lingula anatina]
MKTAGRFLLECVFATATALILLNFYLNHVSNSRKPASIFDTNRSSDAEIDVFQDLLSGTVEALDPRLLEFVKRRLLYAPSKRPRNLTTPNAVHFSHSGQSKVVDKCLRQKLDGFFVEAGAWDGETDSNSLFFEISRNWTGILVEPDPRNFEELVMKNRAATIVQSCITDKPMWVDFALSSSLDSGAIDPINKRIAITGKRKILCLPIQTLLGAMGRTHVDFFSLDVEGVELNVLQAFPWDKITVDMWTVEVHQLTKNYTQALRDIREVFNRTGMYKEVQPLGQDLLFVRKDIH